ncbi:MAG: hypothetical protein ABGX26_00535 [Nautiliaceae bacterium]
MKKIIILFIFLLFLGCQKEDFKENSDLGNGVSSEYLSTTDFLDSFSNDENNDETEIKRV